MTDHLAEAHQCAKDASAGDPEAIKRGILHALIAIADQRIARELGGQR